MNLTRLLLVIAVVALPACGSSSTVPPIVAELPLVTGVLTQLTARLRERSAEVKRLAGPIRIELVEAMVEPPKVLAARVVDPAQAELVRVILSPSLDATPADKKDNEDPAPQP